MKTKNTRNKVGSLRKTGDSLVRPIQSGVKKKDTSYKKQKCNRDHQY